MTSALIAANHLALEPFLRARLSEVFPAPGTRVGGLVEYLDLINGEATQTPAIFVIYDGDTLDSGAASPHQTLARQQWQVVIVLAPPVTAGSADLSQAGEYMARVIKALSGHKLAPELKPLARVADASPLLYGNGLLFVFMAFSQAVDMR